MKLKWSQFTFSAKSVKKNKIILRNTLNSSTVRMERRVKKTIDKVIQNEINYDKEGRIGIYIGRLVDLGMLVSSDADEKTNYYSFFHARRNTASTLGIYIVTTTRCQLKCPYCYEYGIKKKTMNIATADKIITWCKEYLNSHHNCRGLRIIWYGGEPLLNKKIIKYSLPKLYRIAKEKKFTFDNQIVTNGLLLNLEMASFLSKYNLNRIQITLDGPQKIHDNRRTKKNGEGTFNQIFQNILDVIDTNLIEKISLRINFDKNNIDSIPLLLDFLANYNLQKKLDISFGIITPTIQDNLGLYNLYWRKFGYNERECSDKYLWLCKESVSRGFDIPDEFVLGPWCSTREIHSVVIEPDGSFQKCFSGVGRKEFIFGNVFYNKDIKDRRFCDFSYMEQCFDKGCSYVPICGGGCRFNAFLAYGNFYNPHCQFDLLQNINKGLISLKYE